MLIRVLFVFIFILSAIPAFAARTFYIDYAGGSDSYNGTEETHTTGKTGPWKHAPDMNTCTATCASVTATAGDYFVFKGGVTWPSEAIPWEMKHSGSAGKPITYGVNKTWFIGDTWSRPIFDCEYLSQINITFKNQSYLVLDNLDIRRVQTPKSNPETGALIEVFSSHHIEMTNLYVHGWRLEGSGPRRDGAHGGIFFRNIPNNDANTYGPTIILTDSVIENSENSGSGMQSGQAAKYIGIIRRTVIHDVASGVVFNVDFDGSEMYNVAYPSSNMSPNNCPDCYHINGVYSGSMGHGPYYVRNSNFHDIGSGANSALMNPSGTGILPSYVYNNVFYGHQSAGLSAITIETYSYGDNALGTVYALNNLFYMPDSENKNAIHCSCGNISAGRPSLGNFYSINNQFIGDGITQDDVSPANTTGTISRVTNIIQSAKTATSQGYTQSQLWAPQNGSGSTVGKGTDQSKIFTSTINGTTRVAPWDIGPYQH